MRKMTIEETKRVELDILSGIADFCDSHGLRYYLAYGTLIGAVRHKGFIPWDDDIDIQMPRDDYNKMIEMFNVENEGKHLRLISPYDSDSLHSFVKIIDTRTVKFESGFKYRNSDQALGIDVDVFPLDGQPDDDAAYSKWYGKKQKIYKMMQFVLMDPNISWKHKIVCTFLQLVRSKAYYQKKADKLQNPYSFNDSKYVGCTASLYNSKKNRHDISLYSESVLLDFEDKKFKAPVGYHEILTAMYGDYMKLPPEDQQVTHHSNTTYFKDEESLINEKV